MAREIKVSDLRAQTSPRQKDLIRLSVQVDYGGWLNRRERLWYEFPEELVGSGLNRGDPWLVSLLPLAVTTGSPIQLIDIPVDPLLLENLNHLMAVWSDWYPEIAPVPIKTKLQTSQNSNHMQGIAAFFSGGIDSFYTLLTYDQTHPETVKDLIFIHGFDIPISNKSAYGDALARWRTIADELGKRVIPVASNLRETRFRWANWDELAFGCMLAGAGLLLSDHYRTIIINSGLPLAHLRPHGSHPEVDPLFSNSQTGFLQYGQELLRHEKIQHLIGEPLALANMRVCYQSDDGGNCGRCLKCVLIMSILEIYGVLVDAEAFPGSALDLNVLRRTYISQGTISFRNLQQFAAERGRQDIAAAIEAAFVRTKRLDQWLGLKWARKIRQHFKRSAALRRVTADLRPSMYQIGRRLNRCLP